MRRFDRPPEGVCAVMSCRTRAAMWVGRITDSDRGQTTVAVGVCQAHYDAYQRGELEAAGPGGTLLMP